MHIEVGQCPRCTAPIEFKFDTVRQKCDYCGSNIYITDIENSTPFKLRNAYYYLERVKDYKTAAKKFAEIVDINADVYSAWWGRVRALTKEFSKMEYVSNQLKEFANAAISLAPTDISIKYQNEWNSYLNKVITYLKEIEQRKEEKERAERNALLQAQWEKEQEEIAKIKAENARRKKYKRYLITSRTIGAGVCSVAAIIELNIALGNVVPNIYNNGSLFGVAIACTFVEWGLCVIFGLLAHTLHYSWISISVGVISGLSILVGMLSHSRNFFESIAIFIVFGVVCALLIAVSVTSRLITKSHNEELKDYNPLPLPAEKSRPIE